MTTATKRLLSCLAVPVLLSCLTSACSGDSGTHDPKAKFEATPPPAGVTPEAWAKAKKTAWERFDTVCSGCHGKGGKGDGPTGAALPKKPRNYTDAAWQKSITDEKLEAIIAEGGTKHGLDPLMPGAPDLAGDPGVIKALRAIVRSFAK
jgi:cytochrome c553